MTDRERVLAKYPEAEHRVIFVMDHVIQETPAHDAHWLGAGYSESDAWADAAQRLKDNTEEGK